MKVLFFLVSLIILGCSKSDNTKIIKPTINDGKSEVNSAPVNQPPSISPLINLSVNLDSQITPINFTISDDSPLNCTDSIEVSSNNQTLLPDNGIVITGSGPDCVLILNRISKVSGSAVVSLILTDAGGLSANSQFNLTVNTVNDPPIIIDVDDKSTNEDTTITISNITINDDGPINCALNLSVSSSNLALIPVDNILVNGTYPNCSLQITPMNNGFGSSTITITISDSSGLTSTDTFDLSVLPINDPPTLALIQNQSTNEDTPLSNISFLISDVDDSLDCSTSVLTSSSNTGLISSARMSLSGTAPNCSLSADPLSDANGTSTISLTVTDSHEASSNTNFTLTVNSVNDAPRIANIPDQTINEDNPLSPLSLTISDDGDISCSASVSISSSNEALVKATSISITGQVPNCTLSLSPEPNMNGTSTITLTVTDQQNLTTQTSFLLTVNPVNDIPVITLSEEMVVNINSLPATISFTVTDDDALSCTSMVSATSSNTTLLANTGIVISGTAPNCTAVITPVWGSSGVSMIKFTATDSALLSSNKSIRFKVNDFIAAPQNFSTFNKLPSNTVYDVHVYQGIMYVATEGGLAISKDGGETFVTRNASDGIQGYNLMDVFADSSGVYLAAQKGIFVSRDEGKTFTKLTTNTLSYVSVHVNGNNIYAGGGDGLYISRNSGQTFTKAPTVAGKVQDIAVKGTTIYAASTLGLFISSDDGVSFSAKTTSDGLGSNNVRGVYVDAENRVYAATWGDPSGPGGLSILQPGGSTFTNIHQLPGETYAWYSSNMGLYTGVTGDSNGNIYVTHATGGIAISSDNGVSFWGDSNTQGIYRYGLKANIFSGKIYYSSYGGGMGISSDGGVSFTMKTSTTLPIYVTSIQVYKDSNNNEKIYASTLSGIHVSSDNKGSEFTRITPQADVNTVADYTYGLHVVGDKIYFGTNTKGVGIANLDGSNLVYKSTDKGLGNVYVNRVVVNNDKIYACTNGGLSISTDLTGETFTNKTTANGLGSNTVYAVAFDDNGNIYVATAAGLSISTNNGTSFVNKTATLPSTIVKSVFISGGKIYAGTTGGLGISTDLTGSSFSKKTTSQVLKIFVDGNNVYIAGGNYSVSTNGGTSFTSKSELNGIAGNLIYDFSFNEDGDVFLGLYGGAGASGKFSGNQVP